MRNHYTLLCVVALAASFFLPVSTSHAAIVVLDSIGFGNTTGSLEDGDASDATRTVGAAELGTFDAIGADKLVVTIGGEGEGNGAGDNTVTGVTYGGVDMLPVVDRYGNGHRGNSMWYLDDVSVTGDFVITFAENQSGLGFAAYALGGTAAGFADTASTTAESGTDAYNADMEITTTVPGEFVVAAFARNNTDTGGGLGVVDPLVELYYAGTDGSSAAGAYEFVDSPGTVIPTIYRLSNNVGSVIAASFQPVPEPASLAMLAVGGVLAGLRRRRRA